MRKSTKIWLLTAACATVVGGGIFTGVMAALKWDFSKLSTHAFQTQTHTITQTFTNISVNLDTADIRIAPSQNESAWVECYEQEKISYSVTVQEDTLTIECVDNRAWYDYIGINIGEPKITAYVPQGEYDTLSLKTTTGDTAVRDINCKTFISKGTTGDIQLENVYAIEQLQIERDTGDVAFNGCNSAEISVKTTTGDVELRNVTCNNFTSTASTGDLELDNVIASQKWHIERDTGDVSFDNCDGAEIYIKTSTGDVEGSFKSGKHFIVTTSTGDIEYPRHSTGGICEVITSTGDVELDVDVHE